MIKRFVSIQFRLVLAYFALSVFTICICLGAYYWLVSREQKTRHQRELDTATHVQQTTLGDKAERARLMARILASDLDIADSVARADISKLDFLLASRALDMSADVLTVTDADGVVLSQVEPAASGNGLQVRHGDPLFLDALFQRTTSGGSATGLESCRTGVVCINAFAPVRYRSTVRGYVRVGFALDNRFARELRSLTGTDVILVQDVRAVASSLPGDPPASAELRTLLQAMNQARPAKGPGGQQPESGFEISLRGTPYVMRGTVLSTADGRELGRLFMGRETISEQRAFDEALRVMAVIAAVALPLSIIFGIALSVPIVRPLKLVLDRVHEITRGDLRGAVPVVRRDEIGLLAMAFNDMSRTLDERDSALRLSSEQLRLNQEQLIQSGKLAAVGELAAGVAHEIGNPLSAISGYAQMLQKGNIDPETTRDFLMEIEKESEFIERIISDLLDFSRPSSGGPFEVDVQEAIDSAIKTLAAHKAFRNVSLVRDFTDNLPPVMANRKEILQVALNLIMNAAQAMNDGGEITITTALKDGQVIFSVADCGPGVPPEIRDKIFDPFFTTKPTGVGTGLGLPICYRIVEKLNGRITLAERPGGGALFTVTLPAAHPARTTLDNSWRPS